MNNFPIYLVSLAKDSERRKVLAEKFPKNYKKFTHINAVDGRLLSARSYFLEIQQYFKKNNKLISPAELGCTLSHIEALKLFLESGSERGLILEDDVIGNDQDIEIIKSLAFKIQSNCFFICGSQEVINKNNKYLFGRYYNNDRVYEIAKFSHSHIFGTYCYVVTRSSATAILEYQNNNKTLADKWDTFFSNTDIKIVYKSIMSHPLDMTESHIEAERILGNTGFWEKFFSLSVGKRFFTKLRNIFYCMIYTLLPSWKRIH